MPTEKTTTGEEKESRRRVRAVKAVDTTTKRVAAEEEAERGITAAKGRPTPSRRRAEEEEDEEGNLIQRTSGGLREYLRGVRTEIGKVTWPTREDARRLTIIVIIALIASALALGLVSAAFTELFRAGLTQPALLIGFMVIAVGGGFAYYRFASRRSSNL